MKHIEIGDSGINLLHRHEMHPLTAHVDLGPGATFVLFLIAFGPALVAVVLLVVGLLKKGKSEPCKNWFIAAAVSVGIQVIWFLMLSGGLLQG